jgi:hypothetical protein
MLYKVALFINSDFFKEEVEADSKQEAIEIAIYKNVKPESIETLFVSIDEIKEPLKGSYFLFD